MTQEDKDLLLKYLCAALPYHPVLHFVDKVQQEDEYLYGFRENADRFLINDAYYVDEVKPYLRPMSSMTDNEFYEVQSIIGSGIEVREFYIDITWSNTNTFSYLEIYELLNYFLENHIDFLGLIPKGLAIEVTETNNPYNE